MLRIRHGWLVALLAVSTITGCKKDDAYSGAGGAGGAGGAAEKSSDSGGDDLSLLPVDSELVMGINFAQLQQSALWTQFAEKAMKAADAPRKIAEFKAKCGIDPMTAIKTISIGMKGLGGGGGKRPDGVMVLHGIDKTKSLDCLDKMKAEIAEGGAEVTRDGDTVTVKDKNGDSTVIGFANSTTAVAVMGSTANPAGLKAVLAGGSALKTSATFVDMYSKVRTGDSLWFLVSGKVLDKVPGFDAKPKGLSGSINATDGLTFDGRARFDSPDAAAQVATGLKSKVQMLVSLVDKLDITSEADQVKFAVVISSQKLQTLIGNFGAMLGLGAARNQQ